MSNKLLKFKHCEIEYSISERAWKQLNDFFENKEKETSSYKLKILNFNRRNA